MSFGDGNLRERVGDLNRQVDKLQRVNGELCAEINRQERRIRELESDNSNLRIQLEGIKNFAVDEQRRGDALESLVRYMEPWIDGAARKLVIRHMDALGIEVDS